MIWYSVTITFHWFSNIRLLENKNKHLPPGLVLMEDDDRVEVLMTLQGSILNTNNFNAFKNFFLIN